MANIVVYRDPAGVSAPEIYQLNGETNLADWMLNHLTDNISGLHCQITLNGREIVNSETMTIEQCCKGAAIKVGLFDNVTFRFRPQGIELSTVAILAIVAVGAAVLTIALAPKPRIPGQTDTGGSDSNNQLNSSTNSFRPRQAIPDISGQVISYPDFIQPSYYEYQNGQRVFTELFCIGVGYYLVEDTKEGETLISGLQGYESEIFEPGETPTGLLNVRTALASVDLDLLSVSQQTRTIILDNQGEIVTPGTIEMPEDSVSELELVVGNIINFNVSYLDAEGVTLNESGSAELLSFTFNSITIDYTFTEPGPILTAYITNTAFEFVSPWFTLEGDAIEEVRFHLVMPQGIRKGDGTDGTVTATLEVQELDEFGDPVGSAIQRGASFIGNTQSAQRQTFRLGAVDGLLPTRYRARATRITASLGDNALDLLTLEGIDSVTPYTADFGNVTTQKIIRRSSQRVNRGGSTKINSKVTRRLRIYDNDTGIYGVTYEATRRFCDYVFYLLYEKAGVPIAQINTDELFGIQDNLTDDQLGYFDYTFSDDNIALRERIETACNVARVRYWNEGLLWSFVRDEVKSFKSLMFNRRNLTPASSNYAQKFRRPADYDGVTVIYVDPVKNAEKRVSRKIDGSGNIVAGIGIRPLDINLAGCRNDLQALNRCELEVRRLIYQAIKVNDTALNDAQLARIGMRIDWVDMYDSDLFDGELLSVAGNVYTTSERFEPADGVEYWVYVTDDSGQPGNSVRAYARADGNKFGFEADGLTGVYIANGVIQSGSRYFIASNSDSDASTFTVIGRGRPNERGECTIELAEYNELMYEAD